MLKPLIWNISDVTIDDLNWPKKVIGASLLHLNNLNCLMLVGGNFNLIENLNKNLQINANLLKGIDNNIENFHELESEKIKYIDEMVYQTNQKQCEIYIYNLNERKWIKKLTTGKVPVARSFHKCLYISNFFIIRWLCFLFRWINSWKESRKHVSI